MKSAAHLKTIVETGSGVPRKTSMVQMKALISKRPQTNRERRYDFKRNDSKITVKQHSTFAREMQSRYNDSQ